jgi:hypothetical protein
MKFLTLVLIINLYFILGCNNTHVNSFERTNEFFDYLKKHNIALSDSMTNVFILQTDKCGSCTESVIDFIYKKYYMSSEKKLFILSSNKIDIVTKLTLIPKAIIFIDPNHNLDKFGLLNAQDLCLKIDKKEIKEWFFMNNEFIENNK